MLRKMGLGMGLAALVTLLIGTQVTLSQDKKITIRVLVPQADARLSVNKKDIDSNGFERKVVTSIGAGSKEITVTATWEPNGYTKMFRTRKYEVKEGEILADLSRNDPKNPDHIEVIYVPTPDDIVAEMCRLGKVIKDDVVYDLGCGDGRMVITAVKSFGAKRGVGVDINEERVKESKDNAKKAKVEDKVEFRKGDVLKVKDLSDATVVLLYMGDDINNRLKPILKSTLKPGSRIVSHRFTMGDWEPAKTVQVKGKNGYDYTLHLWVIGDKK